MNVGSYTGNTRGLARLVAAAALALPNSIVAADTQISPGGASDGVWYAIPAAFLLGVLAALIIYKRMQRVPKPAPARRPATAPPPEAPLGAHVYLVQQGQDNVRHEITSTPCRIGRSSERNDITLKHPSISRLHAQLTLRKDGIYEITDMESLNGVFVNDRKIKQAPLAEGDIIDIGDLTFRFTSLREP
jgi:hypothetical protein